MLYGLVVVVGCRWLLLAWWWRRLQRSRIRSKVAARLQATEQQTHLGRWAERPSEAAVAPLARVCIVRACACSSPAREEAQGVGGGAGRPPAAKKELKERGTGRRRPGGGTRASDQSWGHESRDARPRDFVENLRRRQDRGRRRSSKTTGGAGRLSGAACGGQDQGSVQSAVCC